MEKSVIKIVGLEQLPHTARRLLEMFENEKVIAFYGAMGAGKTTLIKALCNELHCIDSVSSPTFSIVNEYFTDKQKTIYHFDFYRLKNLYEALDIGVDEYLYSGNFCFLEWPEKIEALLPEQHVAVIIEKSDADESRIIKVQ